MEEEKKICYVIIDAWDFCFDRSTHLFILIGLLYSSILNQVSIQEHPTKVDSGN